MITCGARSKRPASSGTASTQVATTSPTTGAVVRLLRRAGGRPRRAPSPRRRRSASRWHAPVRVVRPSAPPSSDRIRPPGCWRVLGFSPAIRVDPGAQPAGARRSASSARSARGGRARRRRGRSRPRTRRNGQATQSAAPNAPNRYSRPVSRPSNRSSRRCIRSLQRGDVRAVALAALDRLGDQVRLALPGAVEPVEEHLDLCRAGRVGGEQRRVGEALLEVVEDPRGVGDDLARRRRARARGPGR